MAADKAYFFQGSQYWRYNIPSPEGVDSNYPKALSVGWTNMMFTSIDAAVNWGNGKMYFFSGINYARVTINPPSVDANYPKPIAGNWGSLPFATVDAAVNLGNGKALLFSGDRYVSFDTGVNGDVDPGFPKRIAGNLPGLFRSDIDAAVNWGNGKVYFFRGTEYMRYDLTADRVDAGYPLSIAGNWGAGFPASVTAAVERTAAAPTAPRCVPPFEPDFWNDGASTVRRADPKSMQKTNNCYNYATDIPNSTFAQPGQASGVPVLTEDCPKRGAGAMADRLTANPTGTPCSGCCHLVALVIRPGTPATSDFHWYRLDADGTWSHKPGRTPARNTDDSGNIITDPRTANRGAYSDFCGFFCVCKPSVKIVGSVIP
jgi:hypothetical protein